MTSLAALIRLRPLRLEVRTPAAARASGPPAGQGKRGAGVRRLLAQDRGSAHWAEDYADRLVQRVGPGRSVLIQTSMSPSGDFHVGNFRDTLTAHLVARAVRRRGRPARILLSFDDFDAFRPEKVARHPDVGGYASRPMADAGSRSAAICRSYIAELKAVGICPADADADGRLPAGSQWETHYQAERYRAGVYLPEQRWLVGNRRRLARLLGAPDPDRLFTPYCGQCGRNTTVMTRLSPRAVAYRCRSCGARFSGADLRELKPSWSVDWVLRVVHEKIDCEPAGHDHCVAGSTMERTQPVFGGLVASPQPVIVPYGLVRQFREAGKISGSRGGGLRLADLLAVLPARLVLWLYGRPNCRADLRIALDLATITRWYAEYDAFCLAAGDDRRARALWELLTDEPRQPPGAPLPGFRRVVGAVQSHLFDLRSAERALRSAGFAGVPEETLRERLALARTWLATHGRDRCWLPATTELGGRVAVPDGVLDPRSVGRRRLSPAEYHAVRLALFGASTGPPLSRVVDHFGADAVVAALRSYQHDGSRPLRQVLERRLLDREDSV